jgi:S-adenosylmethionine uptake transporter
MSRVALPLPVFAALGGVACLSLMDAFMKGASLAIGAFSAAWLRAVIGAAIMVPLFLLTTRRLPPRAVMKLHVERGVISCFMALTFFYALTKLPLAETIAISFVAPLVALYLARALLGEVIAHGAMWGSVLGFAGAIVIVSNRLGRADFDRDAVLGLVSILVSALLYAYNFIVMRKQSQVAGPIEVALFHSLVTALILAVAAPFVFVAPNANALGATAASAALTVCGAMLLAWAYARAEAQVLVPMEYSGFLWASLFGWLFFREAVAPITLLGTVLIVIGCWIAARRKEPEQVVV